MAFDPNEERDPHGRWTRGGGGELPVTPDPRVATVAGGDIWNKDTAARLENEYAAARPALDKIAEQAPEHETIVNSTPHSWSDLDSSTQEDAAEKYRTSNYDSEYTNEVDHWQDSGDAKAAAAGDLQHDEDWKLDTLGIYIAEREKAGLPEIPYDVADLAASIHLTAASPDEYSNGTNVDPLVQFDKDDLQKPTDLNPDAHHPDQLAMPGISPHLVALEDHLTQAVRADLAKFFIEEFNSKVEEDSTKMEPPEYLHNNVVESLSDSWANMSDEEKYEWTKQQTSLIDDEPEDNSPRALELPSKWDPLNETSGDNYVKTQAMAKYMADTRAAQIMAERKIVGEDRRRSWGAYDTHDLEVHMKTMADKLSESPPNLSAEYKAKYAADIQNMKEELAWRAELGNSTPTVDDIRSVDSVLWDGWKGSSTGTEGQLLQVAAADELGGRLREAPPPKADVDAAYKEFAESKVAQVGSLEEFKAAVKAQLEKVSDIGSFAVKLSMDKNMSDEQKAVARDAIYERGQGLKEVWQVSGLHASPQDYVSATGKSLEAAHELVQTPNGPPMLRTETITADGDDYKLLPELTLQRNGAASFTTDRSVANGWGGTTNKAAQGIDKAAVIASANKEYSKIGGYDGVKAAVRAKWETTQFMLDKADMPVVPLYRGITLSHRRANETQMDEFNPPASGKVKLAAGGEAELSNALAGTSYKIESGKTIIKTSNADAGWAEHGYPKGTGTWKYEEPPRTMSRVVLRAEVPRTAVLSVPAYGQNVHSEHEVVITGTAWHNWDAYSDRAPSHTDVPIGSTAAGPAPKVKLTPREKSDLDKLAEDLAGSEDIVAKYKKTIPKEQQL